jgi:chemotaxis protein CheC
MKTTTPIVDGELDQLRELTSVGAGHASTAFSQLTGRVIEMRPPELRIEPNWSDSTLEGWSSGVLFEFEGCLDALVAILFRASVRDEVVREMLGEPNGTLAQESIEAVIMELGNILVSRVASAIADTLGARLLPSIPVLALEDAAADLRRLCELRGSDATVRVECEFSDRSGELGGLLVLIPDPAEKPDPTPR